MSEVIAAEGLETFCHLPPAFCLLTWAELSWRIEQLSPDPNQPTLQEISEIVKEIRQERRFKE